MTRIPTLLCLGLVALWSAQAEASSPRLTPPESAMSAQCETVSGPSLGAVELRGYRFEATAGGLLIRSNRGESEQVWTACDGLAGTYIQAITNTQDGGALILAIRGHGLWTLDPWSGEHALLLDHEGIRWTTSLVWFEGALWVGTVQKGLWRIEEPGSGARPRHAVYRFRSRRVSALALHPDGDLLVGRDLGGLWRVNAAGRSRRILRGSVQGITVTEAGDVQVNRGARRCQLRGRRCRALALQMPPAPSANRLPTGHLSSLLVHPGPNGVDTVWVGTFDHGVRYRDANGHWQPVLADGDPPRMVNQLTSRGSELWAATATGAFRLHEGRWTRYGESSGLPSDHVNSIHVAPNGTIWFGTSRGLARWDRQGIHTQSVKDGLPYRIVYSVTTLGERVVVGTPYGLGIFDGQRWDIRRVAQGGLADNWVNAVGSTLRGELLVGTYDAGVDVLVNSELQRITGLEGIWVNPNGIVPTWELGGTLFATLGDGLWFRGEDGVQTHWPGPGVLPSNDVTAAVVFDEQLWVATREGLARIALPEILHTIDQKRVARQEAVLDPGCERDALSRVH